MKIVVARYKYDKALFMEIGKPILIRKFDMSAGYLAEVIYDAWKSEDKEDQKTTITIEE